MKQTFKINGWQLNTRCCRRSDHDFVFSLVKETLWPYIAVFFQPSKKMFDERFTEDYRQKVILLRGSRRIGYYQLGYDGKYLVINGIFVSPAYQRRQIGSYLMNYFETLGYKKFKLQVWENNPALFFYKKLGYKKVGKKNHKILMEKIPK